MGILSRLRVAAKHRRGAVAASCLGALGVLWIATEMLDFFFPDVLPTGLAGLGIMAAVAIPVGLYRGLPPTKIRLRFKASDLDLTIMFRDLFKRRGLKVIPVNEFIDSELGELVGENSIHGQLLVNHFGRDARQFEINVDNALKSVQPTKKVPRPHGRENLYPIGTTALVAAANQRFLLVVNCHTDVRKNKANKASSDIPTLWEAMDHLWEAIRTHSNGDPVNVPLLGGGRATTGIAPDQLLQVLLLSLVTSKVPLGCKINVVLYEGDFEKIDLRAIAAQWIERR